MKRNLFLAALLCLAVGAAAQENPRIARLGAYEQDGRLTVGQPRTTLAVDITQEREQIVCGPYARYAQKYLGVRAPLTDKSSYALVGARIALADDARLMASAELPAAEQRVESFRSEGDRFARLAPDRTSATMLPLEEAAREAAATIFSLRRHRLELITGEAGENVFGAGLEAALERIDRLEQSYLELFLGRQVVSVQTRRYIVVPQEGKQQYVVCRFSPQDGLLPEDDLSGDLVSLRLESEGDAAAVTPAGPKQTNREAFRVAASTVCTLMVGNRELARTVLPVFELGRTVEVAVPRRR